MNNQVIGAVISIQLIFREESLLVRIYGGFNLKDNILVLFIS